MTLQIDFDKMQGLVPAIVQDSDSGAVLMLGFMNAEAVSFTLRSGYVTFFSRTRRRMWTKGESSGNRLKVVSVFADCDHDTLLVRAKVEGAGLVCHLGAPTCFSEAVALIPEHDQANPAETQL